jgi:hypothetical protein
MINSPGDKMKTAISVFSTFALALSACAQITIHSNDMFTEIGQYSRSYGSNGGWDTAGVMGPEGGPQVWDFSTGPQDNIARVDIVASSDGGHGSSFPNADWAEHQSLEGQTDTNAWWYWSLDGGLLNHGLYSTLVNQTQPNMVYSPATLDYPDPLNFGSTWQTSTTFYTEVDYEGSLYDARIQLSTSNQIDAFGTLIVPQGEAACLRHDKQSQAVVSVWIIFGWVPLTTFYNRSYSWLAEDRGYAAMLISEESEAGPPAADFASAASFLRLFETNHAGANPPGAVNDLEIAFGIDGVTLNWSATEFANSYRVEYSTDAWFANSVSILTTTTDTTAMDVTGLESDIRFYRVIALD